METTTFQLFAAKHGGGNTWITFRALGLYYNTIFLGVKEIEVDSTPIMNVAQVKDWAELYKQARDYADQYFQNLNKVVA